MQEARKLQKLKAKDNSEKLRERLLNNFLQQKALDRLSNNDDKSTNGAKCADTDMFALPPLSQIHQDEDDIEQLDIKLFV